MSTSFPFINTVSIHHGPFGDDTEHGVTRTLLAAFRVGRVVIGVVRHSTAGEDQPRADLTARFAESLDQLDAASDIGFHALDDLSDAARAASCLLIDTPTVTGGVKADLREFQYSHLSVEPVEIPAAIAGGE